MASLRPLVNDSNDKMHRFRDASDFAVGAPGTALRPDGHRLAILFIENATRRSRLAHCPDSARQWRRCSPVTHSGVTDPLAKTTLRLDEENKCHRIHTAVIQLKHRYTV